ncbi:hypothetical protein [Pseudovibrio sp. Tun.PSC04-5.I4]|uniref:hypothetical protein n=1 Tax=Pseudovibrio sp. Tun.PSC04-5.I4 TaxID=1798213 RepID=UPI00087FC013|nr:hypothetical protein [Pseudovibrio sp. Tun.PSC04-5.I4]SDR37343.1 hypothetical protein SAMN04515695_5080 [Pseudovibrio sp. Tun.PSC04-5.I4]
MNMIIDGLNGIGWKKQKDTADEVCRCNSLKEHWIQHSRKSWPAKCGNVGCHNKPTHGAHVKWLSGSRSLIIPLCASCNKQTERFNVRDGIVTVAKYQLQCG